MDAAKTIGTLTGLSAYSERNNRMRSPRMSLLRTVLLGLTVVVSQSGCGLFYENSYNGSGFNVYSDRNAEFVGSVGAKVSHIYRGFGALFEIPPERLGTTTIVLDGDDDTVVDPGYSPSVLGYYVPMFNYIRVDTNPAWARTDAMLQQILLHEVAHHFIVTEFPKASKRCWLNEGLAGTLEVTLFEDEHFEYPLFNPALYQIAQAAAYDRNHPPRLQELVELGWGEFHDAECKERHYALSWAFCYYILERHLPAGMSLGQRIEALYELTERELLALEPGWRSFLRGFDFTGHLLKLASATDVDRQLTARWAIEQLAKVRPLNDLRVLVGLAELFDDPDPSKRLRAYWSFLRTLERNPHSHYLKNATVQAALVHIGEVLEAPSADREIAARWHGAAVTTAAADPEAVETSTAKLPGGRLLENLAVRASMLFGKPVHTRSAESNLAAEVGSSERGSPDAESNSEETDSSSP